MLLDFNTTYLEVERRDFLLPFNLLFLSAAEVGSSFQLCHSWNELGTAPLLVIPISSFLFVFQAQGVMTVSHSYYLFLVLSVPFVLALNQFLVNHIPYIKLSLFKCLVKFLFLNES